jgi:hypothetical protein
LHCKTYSLRFILSNVLLCLFQFTLFSWFFRFLILSLCWKRACAKKRSHRTWNGRSSGRWSRMTTAS